MPDEIIITSVGSEALLLCSCVAWILVMELLSTYLPMLIR